jgi:hypothetical protein
MISYIKIYFSQHQNVKILIKILFFQDKAFLMFIYNDSVSVAITQTYNDEIASFLLNRNAKQLLRSISHLPIPYIILDN